jgi:hypothetical protein
VSAINADIRVDETALGKLSASFKGELVRPGNATYDEHRKVWNGSIDRFPALIARCRGVADVIAEVRFARSSGLPVAVRGGESSVKTASLSGTRSITPFEITTSKLASGKGSRSASPSGATCLAAARTSRQRRGRWRP